MPGGPRRDGRADHVRGEHPAIDDADVALPEAVGDQGDGRRHGRDVVEPEQDRERPDRQRVVDERQEQQADAPEAVVHEEQLARVPAVGQPAAGERAHEVEEAHDGQRPGGRDGREAVVHGVRDEVLADQAVGGRAAHEERAGQEPEVARPHGPAHDPRLGRRHVGDRALGGAQRSLADVGRVVADPAHDRDEEDEAQRRQDQGPEPPAGDDGERRQEREEDELPGARAGPQDAGHEPAILDEPAGRHGRPEHARDEPGPEAGEQPEDEGQLPDLADQARGRQRERGHGQAQDDDVAHADAAHQPAAQGAGQAEHDQSDRGGEGHGARSTSRARWSSTG